MDGRWGGCGKIQRFDLTLAGLDTFCVLRFALTFYLCTVCVQYVYSRMALRYSTVHVLYISIRTAHLCMNFTYVRTHTVELRSEDTHSCT